MHKNTVKQNSGKNSHYILVSLSLLIQLSSRAEGYGCPARPLIKPCSCKEITTGLDVSCEGMPLMPLLPTKRLIDRFLTLKNRFPFFNIFL